MNDTFDIQNAKGDISTAASIANKFQSERLPLQLSFSSRLRFWVDTLEGIPIVFSEVTDTVKAGGRRFSEKGDKNIIGVSDMTGEAADQTADEISRESRDSATFISALRENAVVLAV